MSDSWYSPAEMAVALGVTLPLFLYFGYRIYSLVLDHRAAMRRLSRPDGPAALAREKDLSAATSAIVVRVPVPAVEAAIALSIVFLAVEIVRGDPNSLTYRYPIAVSSSFGLLHGFGFAAVLGETGLPQTEIPAALLFFNIGVELGQILFVVAVIAAYQIVRFIGKNALGGDLSIDALRPLQTPAAYAVGMLAAFWMIERVASFWTA